jgi:hypothetical protein
MECNRTIPLTSMSKSPRNKCISAFSLRGSYRISDTSGELKMGYKFILSKTRAKSS